MYKYSSIFALCMACASAVYAQNINVTSAGVGIGTTAPSGRLEVYGGGRSLFFNQAAAGDTYMLYHVPGVRWWSVGAKANGDFWFSRSSTLSTDDLAPLVITSPGNVGIGTSSPQEKLEVAGNIKVNSAVLAPAGAAPLFAARAWVNFNGLGAIGTDQVIRASGNVSRVYKSANGTYTIYFTTALPDDNICVLGTGSHDGANSGRMINPMSISAAQVQIQTRAGSGSLLNTEYVSVAFIR